MGSHTMNKNQTLAELKSQAQHSTQLKSSELDTFQSLAVAAYKKSATMEADKSGKMKSKSGKVVSERNAYDDILGDETVGNDDSGFKIVTSASFGQEVINAPSDPEN